MEDLSGRVFGRLTVIERFECKGNPKWICTCTCGSEVIKLGSTLRSGDTKSCGCLRKEINTKHGMCRSLTYNSWSSMVSRVCGSYKDPVNSKYYEGMFLDPEWRIFENFLEDMGERPSKDISLDRIDPSKGYYKDNCRWADKTTQARNTKDKGKSGVYFRRDRNKWQAQIRVGAKTKYLGLYDTKEEALNARKDAEYLYWSEDE